MFETLPRDVDYDRRWEHLLELIDEERGGAGPEDRVYPESDDSSCWPMPYTPTNGPVPGTVSEMVLSGTVAVLEATWTFTEGGVPVAPRLRAAAGWLPSVDVVAGRIPRLRDVDFLPLTTLGDGTVPLPTPSSTALADGVDAMLAYDDLLARSALAGVQFPAGGAWTVSTAATEVSEYALACGELARWEDLEIYEALARQELRTETVIRRSYVWFDTALDDDLTSIPGPERLTEIETAFEHLGVPRSMPALLRWPLRSVTFGARPTAACELDHQTYSLNEVPRRLAADSLESSAKLTSTAAPRGSAMHDQVDAVLDVTRLFTAAIENAMASHKIARAADSSERHRARHEGVAQYLLDHLLHQDGELERLVELLGLDDEFAHALALYTEWPDGHTGSRFDHVVDDRHSIDDYRSVLVIEDKIDAQLAPGQLDRYCEFLDDEDGRGVVLVLHPERNPLRAERLRAQELEAAYGSVNVRFMTWSQLSTQMIAANPSGPHTTLWRALAEYAETVGTGDLASLPLSACLDDPEVARELRDLFLTVQGVAARVAHGGSRQLRFSFHGGNTRPWLQMAMTDLRQAGLGLQLDLDEAPGTLLVGVRGPEDPDGGYIPSKVGAFPDGQLNAAADRRVDELAQLADRVRSGGAHFPDRLRGKTSGSALSAAAQDALRLLAAVFQAQAVKNPHRGGAPSRRTQGVNEGDGRERLGARLVRESDEGERTVWLFIGPPAGQDWERATIWIRDGEDEREIDANPGETGRDYVLRVWEEARYRLSATA